MYYARNIDTHKKSVKIATAVLAIVLVLLGLGVMRQGNLNFVAIVFGILLFLSVLLKKEVTVSKDGLHIFYNMRIATHQEHWNWEDMYAVTYEKDKESAMLWRIYFTKGERTKKFCFTEEDMRDIIALAQEQNHSIHVYDAAKTKKKRGE